MAFYGDHAVFVEFEFCLKLSFRNAGSVGLDADCTNDVIENIIFDVGEDLLAESRDAMLNEAVERCCQDIMIARVRGEYTSHPILVLTKHDGPNATAMMAKDIVRLYVYDKLMIFQT